MKIIFFFSVLVLLITVSVKGQTYFNMVQKFPASACEPYCNPNPDFNQIKPISYTDALLAFNYLSRKSNAQFNYPQGGCPERALILHYLLDSIQISNFRIWVFAPSKLIENDTRKIFIYDKNTLTTDSQNKIEWDFHVAPCVLSKNQNGEIDTLVFDPSIDGDRPLQHTEWLNSIGNHEIAEYTFLDGKYYQFNKQNNGYSNVINGYFYPYKNFAYDNLWLEKMLSLNDVAYEMFEKYVQDKDRNLQDVMDIRSVIGNSATLKEVLDFKDGTPASSKIRYLASKYPKFSSDMWTMYSVKLVYWTQRIQRLR
ncbi:protein-glutamine glutaminase family protein [Arcicella sp. DC2W]|uniref:Protein-glutamine glutaminase family protein n=1 Tax=Arcicella gelida TaxID=2984195 RepID=A0ABU5S2X6_9BACT|nr:protein-glutamine glutaminase family protein [Arcicella sp. DC2W]MEA5402838.1 protein-glutamine glutaminase family protein [Arcicella sp. DC2W]